LFAELDEKCWFELQEEDLPTLPEFDRSKQALWLTLNARRKDFFESVKLDPDKTEIMAEDTYRLLSTEFDKRRIKWEQDVEKLLKVFNELSKNPDQRITSVTLPKLNVPPLEGLNKKQLQNLCEILILPASGSLSKLRKRIEEETTRRRAILWYFRTYDLILPS
jgi:hypothetical protein